MLKLRVRLRTHLLEKVAVLLGLALGICIPYFSLQQIEAFPLRSVPVTRLDLWIAFDSRWVWAYQSIALLVPLAPLLATTRQQLVRYSTGLASMCGVCFAFFLFFPVEGPRPPVVPEHGMYQLLIGLDRPTNSIPSLHAGLTAYSILFAYEALRGALTRRSRWLFLGVALGWAGSILYATIATKQHWLVDLPPGILIAWLAHRSAWRGATREE